MQKSFWWWQCGVRYSSPLHLNLLGSRSPLALVLFPLCNYYCKSFRSSDIRLNLQLLCPASMCLSGDNPELKKSEGTTDAWAVSAVWVWTSTSVVKLMLLVKAALSVASMSSMPTENCWLVSFDIVSHLIVHSNFALAYEGRPVQYVKPPEGIVQSMNWWKYIVMDGCMLLNESSTISETAKREKD